MLGGVGMVRRAGSSVVERSIAARRVTGSIPVPRFLLLPSPAACHLRGGSLPHSCCCFSSFQQLVRTMDSSTLRANKGRRTAICGPLPTCRVKKFHPFATPTWARTVACQPTLHRPRHERCGWHSHFPMYVDVQSAAALWH